MNVGDTIGRYQIAAVFEDDPSGSTYQVWDVSSGSRHVLKVRPPTADPELHDALKREYRIQHSLKHPNVAYASRLIELPDGSTAMVLDHADGGALATWMTGKPVAPGMCRVVLEGLLAGLGAAHAAGFVHRDVKPENILLTREGVTFVAQLADFGLARDAAEAPGAGPAGISLHYSTLGTPGYMAPEQAADAATADARSDLFSVGCVLHELLTGELPVDPDAPGFMLKLLQGEWDRSPDVPAWAQPVLEALLQPGPAKRPASCAEVEAMLAMPEATGGDQG